MDESVRSFKEKLDQAYQWPALYTFKFISPKHKVGEVKSIFPNHSIKERASSKGSYISVTVSIMARSSDEIIQYYQEVHRVGDIISL